MNTGNVYEPFGDRELAIQSCVHTTRVTTGNEVTFI